MHIIRVRVPALPVAAVVFLLLAPLGCDLLGEGDPSIEEVPPERLAAASAVFEDSAGRPFERLLLFDIENPSTHEVLAAPGSLASRPCFGPEKRRLLFEDRSEGIVGSRSAIKLLDLRSREVQDLAAVGDLDGCVWRADESGFYYSVALGGGLRRAGFYDLTSDETRAFGQREDRTALMPYGRKGRDSILVLGHDLRVPLEKRRLRHYFVDAETSMYLKEIKDENLKGTQAPAYNDKRNWIVARFNHTDNDSLSVMGLNGDFVKVFDAAPPGHTRFRWGPGDTILFVALNRTGRSRVMSADVSTGETRELIGPKIVDGAVKLGSPDY